MRFEREEKASSQRFLSNKLITKRLHIPRLPQNSYDTFYCKEQAVYLRLWPVLSLYLECLKVLFFLLPDKILTCNFFPWTLQEIINASQSGL